MCSHDGRDKCLMPPQRSSDEVASEDQVSLIHFHRSLKRVDSKECDIKLQGIFYLRLRREKINDFILACTKIYCTLEDKTFTGRTIKKCAKFMEY